MSERKPTVRARRRAAEKPPENNQQRRFSLSLIETILTILIAIIGVGQITLWLSSSSKIARNQSQVEIMNIFIDQAYQDYGNPNPKTPMCMQVQGAPKMIVYVICDSQKLIAEDEFEFYGLNSDERLSVRRFFDKNGAGIIALDRYEYASDASISSITRIIFQNLLGIVRCAYIENRYNPDGVLTQNRFTGSCGENMAEIPSYRSLKTVPPPPIMLFMPYR